VRGGVWVIALVEGACVEAEGLFNLGGLHAPIMLSSSARIHEGLWA
jgi:hypothetical protein